MNTSSVQTLRSTLRWPILLLCMFLSVPETGFSQSPLLRNGSRIVFFGDSITELGVKPGGYVDLLRDSLGQVFDSLSLIGAGISGHRVPDLQRRIGTDVIAHRPDIVVVYIGINDVWHRVLPGHLGTSQDDFVEGLHELVGKLKAAGAVVILCTPSVIGEKHDGSNPLDSLLDEYAGLVRNVASEHDLLVCDLRAIFLQTLRRRNHDNAPAGILTYDKVHLSDAGNRLVAGAIGRVLMTGTSAGPR